MKLTITATVSNDKFRSPHPAVLMEALTELRMDNIILTFEPDPVPELTDQEIRDEVTRLTLSPAAKPRADKVISTQPTPKTRPWVAGADDEDQEPEPQAPKTGPTRPNEPHSEAHLVTD